MTLLYEPSGAPFNTTGAIQARHRDLMGSKGLGRVHAALVAREMIDANQRFSFHGLGKNACCYLLELGLADTEAGAILGVSGDGPASPHADTGADDRAALMKAQLV